MRTFARRPVGIVMAFAMVVNAACYAYVPPPQGIAPKSGDLVRIKLNPSGTDELARFLGPRVEYAEGLLSDVRGDGSLVVGVNSVRLLDGIDNYWNGSSVVTFAPSQVADVQVRVLDKHKTRIATVATVVAVLGIFAIAIGLGGAHGGPDTGVIPPPP